jgi:transcriptional regulator with XRE-family HTH domain
MQTIDKDSTQAYKVGQAIRRLRLDSRITPREFSDELNATQSFVARLEQGLVDITPTIISKSAQLFDVPEWQILGGPHLCLVTPVD